MNKKLPIYLIVILTCFCAGALAKRGGAPGRVVTVSQTFNPDDVLDAMETSSGWNSYADKGAKVTLSNVPGRIGQAFKISYDMSGGAWVAISKNINKDLSKAKKIRLFITGEGSPNSIELRFEDFSETNFGALLPQKTNAGAWTVAEIPISKFNYWWGKNQIIDWKRIKNLHIAIAKKDGDQGGSGKVIIDQVEIAR